MIDQKVGKIAHDQITMSGVELRLRIGKLLNSREVSHNVAVETFAQTNANIEVSLNGTLKLFFGPITEYDLLQVVRIFF